MFLIKIITLFCLLTALIHRFPFDFPARLELVKNFRLKFVDLRFGVHPHVGSQACLPARLIEELLGIPFPFNGNLWQE